MGDYAPVALPGQLYTFTTSTVFAGGDLAEVTGVNTVGEVSTLGSVAYVGVAATDAASGAPLTVILAKAVHESVAEGTITAGAQIVTSAVAGRHVKTLIASAADVGVTPTQASINTALNLAVNQGRSVLGVAITTATDNTKVRWVER